MRRTLTIDADVDAALIREVRQSGLPFKEVVNRTLRSGLMTRKELASGPGFKVNPLPPMGLREGLSLRSVSALEEFLDEEEQP